MSIAKGLVSQWPAGGQTRKCKHWREGARIIMMADCGKAVGR